MGKHSKQPFRRARICACGDHGFVGLTLGHTALFSPEDLGQLSVSNWSCLPVKGGPYVRGSANGRVVLMHRAITNAPKGAVVDHRNHNGLDNRRENLRVCSQSDNAKNRRATKKTSRFKGVHLLQSGRWGSQICTDGVRRSLGSFLTEEEAAQAYKIAARKAHGEFAYPAPEGSI